MRINVIGMRKAGPKTPKPSLVIVLQEARVAEWLRRLALV